MSVLTAVLRENSADKIKKQNNLDKQHFDSYIDLRTLMLNGCSPEDLGKAINQYSNSEKSALEGRVSIMPKND